MQTYDEKITKEWKEYQDERNDASLELTDTIEAAQEKYRRRVVAAYDRYLKLKERAFKGE